MRISKLVSKMKNISKKTSLFVMVPLVSVAVLGLVTNTVNAGNVLMEGNTESLNVTQGQTTYGDSTNALVDDVVQVQLWYHNREVPEGEKALNTKVKFDVPTAQGKLQTIVGTTSSDNSNTVQDNTNVNLSLDRSRLEYIPGSAKWRYNKAAMEGDTTCQTGMNHAPERCYATVPISDSVVTSPTGVNLGTTPGCNAYHATVTIQLRVRADVVSVNKFVRHKGQGSDAWKTETTAKPGDKLEYMIKFRNEGNTQLNDVMVGDNLPKYNSYVENSTNLKNGANPNGLHITNNNITRGGINVGNYMPGAVGYVWFEAALDPIQAYPKCGVYDIRNVGVVRPAGMNEFYNTAIVKINVECAQVTPKFVCEALDAEKINRTTFRFTGRASAENATITSYAFSLNGNQVQDSANNVYTLTQETPGEYTVSLIVKTDKGNTAPSAACTKKVTVVQQPSQPTFSCDALDVTKVSGRQVKYTARASAAGGAEIKWYSFNFGDGTTEFMTDQNTAEHTYAKDGQFTTRVKVGVMVDNALRIVESDKCAAVVNFTSSSPTPTTTTPPAAISGKPTSLVNAGPGSVAAIFGAVTAAGAVAHRILLGRRLRNEA